MPSALMFFSFAACIGSALATVNRLPYVGVVVAAAGLLAAITAVCKVPCPLVEGGYTGVVSVAALCMSLLMVDLALFMLVGVLVL